jgi:DNA-binding CsgD family transcriptional regulator
MVDDAFAGAPPPPDEESPHAKFHALSGAVIVDDAHRCCLTLLRNADRGGFSDLENEALQTLMGYFRRAVILNRRFIDISNQNKTMGAVLSSAPRGIVTLGQNGQTTYLNTEAKRIFSQADGLSLTNNRINFDDAKIRTRFLEFLERARQNCDTEGKQERMSAMVRRDSVTTPYQLMAYTLLFNKRQASFFEDEALAILIIQDATTNLELRAELLQTFYNLSSAEARLAVALYKGSTLPDAADELHISINTARSQLRNVFKKVGVNSQAMLLQTLTAGVKEPPQGSDNWATD